MKWSDVAKKSANALFVSAQSSNALDQVHKDLSRAAKAMSDGKLKDDIWGGYFKDMAREYNQLLEKRQDLVVVEVVVALPMDDEDRRKLQNALKNFTKMDVEIEEIVDPDIIGGIIVKIQDRVVDDSIVHRLDLIKTKISEGTGI